jgi:hypothetical protein
MGTVDPHLAFTLATEQRQCPQPVINVLAKHPLMSDTCDATRCISSARLVSIT